MPKILMVEDDQLFARSAKTWLENDQHTVELLHSVNDALDRILFYKYDVFVFDVNLPDGCGFDLCQQVRASSDNGSAGIVMLTGMRNIADKERGFALGADDYVGKPCELKELSMRVRALLRRPAQFVPDVLKIDDVVLDPGRFKVTRAGKTVELLPKEFALLHFLMRHQGQIFSTEALLERVWVSDTTISTNAVITCMRRLRVKIDQGAEPPFIRTIHGVGYTIE